MARAGGWLLVSAALALAGCERPPPAATVAAASAAASAPVAATTATASPAVILVGASWIGLWVDGKVQRETQQPGWQFNAARLAPDGSVLEVAAYAAKPAAIDDGAATVLRFNTRTLALLGSERNAQAGQWPPLPAPVGIDTPEAPDAPPGFALLPGAKVAAVAGDRLLTALPDAARGMTVQPWQANGQGIGPPQTLPPGDWRLALSPDGRSAAAFLRGTAARGAAWAARVWDLASGQTLPSPGLAIDDGGARPDGAARALACLLPQGAGAIVTYLGAPADRRSEFVPFSPPGAAAVRLDTPYVTSCLQAPAAASLPR